jgi:hypothetical protein
MKAQRMKAHRTGGTSHCHRGGAGVARAGELGPSPEMGLVQKGSYHG